LCTLLHEEAFAKDRTYSPSGEHAEGTSGLLIDVNPIVAHTIRAAATVKVYSITILVSRVTWRIDSCKHKVYGHSFGEDT